MIDKAKIGAVLRASPSVKVAAATLGVTEKVLFRACRGSLGADYWACRTRGVQVRTAIARTARRAQREARP